MFIFLVNVHKQYYFEISLYGSTYTIIKLDMKNCEKLMPKSWIPVSTGIAILSGEQREPRGFDVQPGTLACWGGLTLPLVSCVWNCIVFILRLRIVRIDEGRFLKDNESVR